MRPWLEKWLGRFGLWDADDWVLVDAGYRVSWAWVGYWRRLWVGDLRYRYVAAWAWLD